MCQPGRPSPQGRRPRRLAGLREFPQREIQRVAFCLAGRDARADLEFVDVPPGERAVALERAHRVVDAVLDDVGVARLDQLPDHLEDLRDVRRRARLAIGLQHVQAAHRALERGEVPLDDRRPQLARLAPARDAPIVDIGHVLHERDAVPAMHEIAPQHVEEHERTRVPEMRLRRRRQAADVDPHLAVVQGPEVIGRVRACVI